MNGFLRNLLSNLKHFLQTMLIYSTDSIAVRSISQKPGTMLLIQLDAIGDYILFRNFIYFLKQSDRFCGYKITFCGNIACKELAESLDSDFINDFIWINRSKFRYNVLYRYRLVREISQRGFEIAVHSAYSRIFYWGDSIIRACGAYERIGSSGDTTNIKGWQKKLSDSFYTRLIPASGKMLFEFCRNREFFEGLLGTPLNIAKPAIDILKIPAGNIPAGRFAVLFPGAGEEFKQWSTGNFAEVADYLNARYGLTVVIAGSAGEKELAARIVSRVETREIIDLSGRTELTELARIIAGAELLVSNETSAVHMAVSVDAKVVCISNGNEFGRFSPYPAEACDKAFYVYPEAIRMFSADFDSLSEQFRTRSRLDINSISVEKVKEMIDLVLG